MGGFSLEGSRKFLMFTQPVRGGTELDGVSPGSGILHSSPRHPPPLPLHHAAARPPTSSGSLWRRGSYVGSRVCVQLGLTLWIIAHKAPLSIQFSRQEYWSGLPFSPPGALPNPGIEPMVSPVSCIGRQILYHESHLRNPVWVWKVLSCWWLFLIWP